MPWVLKTIARRWQIFTLIFFQRSTSAKMLKKLFVESPSKSKLLAQDIYSSVDKLIQTLIIPLYSLNTLLSFADTLRVPIQLSCYGSELDLFYIPHLIFSIEKGINWLRCVFFTHYRFNPDLSFMNYGLNTQHFCAWFLFSLLNVCLARMRKTWTCCKRFVSRPNKEKNQCAWNCNANHQFRVSITRSP